MKTATSGIGLNNMRKTYFVNEFGFPDGYNTFDVHRLPVAYMHHLKWYSVSYETLQSTDIESDAIIIFQTPCNNELQKLSIAKQYVDHYTCCITQESSIFDWFDWPAAEQEIYIYMLSKCAAFLYHSEHDKTVMQVFCKNFIKFQGCVNLTTESAKTYEEGQFILIPNPVKRYQRGMIVHKLVSDIDTNIPIYSMKYNAPKNIALSFPDAYTLPNINSIGWMHKEEWFHCIYSSKFGVDIHREFSGGNVALEFASLSTPLVGNIQLDVQRDLFPDISFEYTDYNSIQKAINMLICDKDFYNDVSKKALENVKKLYNSFDVTNKFSSDLYDLLKV